MNYTEVTALFICSHLSGKRAAMQNAGLLLEATPGSVLKLQLPSCTQFTQVSLGKLCGVLLDQNRHNYPFSV